MKGKYYGKPKKKCTDVILCHKGKRESIRQKMYLSKAKNMGSYLRKMAIDGYIVNTYTTPLKKQFEEMHKIGGVRI